MKRHEMLSATAELDQVIFDGASFGTGALAGTPEEEEYLGLPGLLTADQVSTLLNKRQADQLAAQRRRSTATAQADGSGGARVAGMTAAPPGPVSAGERRVVLRRQLNALVAAHHHRTGQPHGKIHAELTANLRRSAQRPGHDRAARGADRHRSDALRSSGTPRGVPDGSCDK